MLTANPDIARPTHRIDRGRGRLIMATFRVSNFGQEAIEVGGIKPGQIEIKVGFPEIFEFKVEQFVVPFRPVGGSVRQQPKRLDLGIRELVREHDRDIFKPELPGCLKP